MLLRSTRAGTKRSLPPEARKCTRAMANINPQLSSRIRKRKSLQTKNIPSWSDGDSSSPFRGAGNMSGVQVQNLCRLVSDPLRCRSGGCMYCPPSTFAVQYMGMSDICTRKRSREPHLEAAMTTSHAADTRILPTYTISSVKKVSSKPGMRK